MMMEPAGSIGMEVHGLLHLALNQSNLVTDINSHIGDFPVTFSGIRGGKQF